MTKDSAINFGQRLKLARLGQKMSMETLAERMGGAVTKQAISKYENGKMVAAPHVACKLAEVLNTDMEYFFRPVTVDISKLDVSFRKKSSLGARDITALTVNIQDDIERFIEIANILDMSTEVPLHIAVDEPLRNNSQMSALAMELRKEWELGNLPIANVQDLLESKGIAVLYREGPNNFDGISGIVNACYHIMVLNYNMQMAERRRFTALHELCHLLFNQHFAPDLSSHDKEKLCHAFASEMLLPSSVLADKFDNKTRIPIKELELIQTQYGISIDAILHKLHEMKIFGEKRYRSYQIRKNTEEGLRQRVETSRFSEARTPRFEAMVYKALGEGLITESKAAALLNTSVFDVHNDFSLL